MGGLGAGGAGRLAVRFGVVAPRGGVGAGRVAVSGGGMEETGRVRGGVLHRTTLNYLQISCYRDTHPLTRDDELAPASPVPALKRGVGVPYSLDDDKELPVDTADLDEDSPDCRDGAPLVIRPLISSCSRF
jgi:hypothetical protein